MPGWRRPNDISFDRAAAAAAMDALASFRFTLASTWAREQAAANVALGDWEGRAAEAFATSLQARRAGTEDVRRELLRLERAIQDGADDARVEQARAERLQSEWDLEQLTARYPHV